MKSGMAPAGFALQGSSGKGVQAYAPLYPHQRQEQWIFILADASNNAIFTWSLHTLLEAESAGLKQQQSQLSLEQPENNGGLRKRASKGSSGDLSRAGDLTWPPLPHLRAGRQQCRVSFLRPPAGRSEAEVQSAQRGGT